MWIQPIQLQKQSELMKQYRQQAHEVLDKFHYNPFESSDYQQRCEEINERSYQRERLAEHLRFVNEQWGASDDTLANIERLKQPNSVVVVGGQQAGLLTGPLYTIHKIVSILVMAREQEAALGVPVIPIFWIAGEDHDYEEINHVYMPQSPRMKKFRIMQKQLTKASISEVEMDYDHVITWLDRLFAQMKETSYTTEVYQFIKEKLDQSNSFVDFFAKLTTALFAEKGLVLLDAHHPQLRTMESDYFKQMIHHQSEISKGVAEALNESSRQGYVINLDVDIQDGHLFYHHNGDRILLVRNQDGLWEGKNGECSFTLEEMLDIAEHEPSKLSNNVVTRPLMQDLLLPTLAFVGGPGEIAYWSVLKPAFESVGVQMPPVVPRKSITLLDRKSEKCLNRHMIDVEKAISFGVAEQKNQWIAMQSYPPIEQLSDEVKKAIERAHRPLKEKAKEIQADLGQLAEKNLFHLFRDVEFLQERMESALQEKYRSELEMFDTLDVIVNPEDGLQERMWNILPWMNEYGLELPNRLCEQSFDVHDSHYVVYL
ncbi:hypothetical protein N784_07715 [Pontibacillus litoralis JSM 072002]|uniref:Putative cysteine ligase BshC n=2 Tax=Pontibacillus TaxID=289201 RepID=A0A0A5GBI4_9BACI|nr:hypothetical protein N784_07715 [Pontibacillus litoralis JSM 072002]